jgi:hypothetical protein
MISGQIQFREMIEAGLHHFQDPKQLIFLQKLPTVVNAVIAKEIDVGFVRTDQLERSMDPETGKPLDLAQFKIINQKHDLMSNDGSPFPFISSSPLYPEWSFSSFSSTVGEDVAKAVQSSLLKLGQRAEAAVPLKACFEQYNCNATLANVDMTECGKYCLSQVDPAGYYSCETDAYVLELAEQATNKGKCAGFIPSLSHMTIRNMQDDIGIMSNENGSFHCVRGKQLADKIVCPAGHFKKSPEDIATGCEQMGLPCRDFSCICKPCVKAYDVDFFADNGEERQVGCGKFEVCGAVQQSHKIRFLAVDNRKRLNATFLAHVWIGEEVHNYAMTHLNPEHGDHSREENLFTHEFEFDATDLQTGFLIVEVTVDGVQIPGMFSFSFANK